MSEPRLEDFVDELRDARLLRLLVARGHRSRVELAALEAGAEALEREGMRWHPEIGLVQWNGLKGRYE